ncbi:hypothetical protein K492DRAFT_148364 [Lichtheimia hyalospora FSU 10163]|nr:hypothetical protein K492DRAFT_148364 [Lichtheimia hyalospora FSU 10163]
MAFGQLTNVRADGIVDEGIVFRALWQRMALQRIIFPDQHIPSQQLRDAEALDEYFDVDSDRRHQILLGTPKYRFCVSIQLPSPNAANGWNDQQGILDATTEPVTPAISESSCSPPTDVIWKKTCYSDTKEILGNTYRIRVDAQSIAGRLLYMCDDEHEHDDILLCRFGLDSPMNGSQSQQSNHQDKSIVHREPKIKYSIYCINRHQHITENDQISDEDRVMIPVSEQSRDDPNSRWSGTCSKVRMDGYDKERGMLIDLVVVLELTF